MKWNRHNNYRKSNKKHGGLIISVVLLLIIVGFGGFQVYNRQNKVEYRQKGIESFNNQQYEESEEQFLKALDTVYVLGQGIDEDIKYYLGASYYQSQQYEKAIETYDELLNENKTDQSLYCLKGACYAKLEQYDQAEALFKQAKDYDESLNYLGKLAYEQEDYKASIAYEEEYLKKNSNSSFAYNLMALSYIAQEDYDKALQQVEKGLSLKDESMKQDLLFNEVVIYEAMLDFKTAYAKIKDYVTLYPEDTNAVREMEFLETR